MSDPGQSGWGTDEAMERALGAALRPVDLPPQFTERVLARKAAGDIPATLLAQTPGQGRAVLLAWPEQRRWLGGAAAAAVVLGLLGGGVAHQRVQAHEQRVLQADAQFATAERITDQALAQTREQIARAGVRLEP